MSSYFRRNPDFLFLSWQLSSQQLDTLPKSHSRLSLAAPPPPSLQGRSDLRGVFQFSAPRGPSSHILVENLKGIFILQICLPEKVWLSTL